MSSETLIEVDHLSKCYQIYEKPRDRLLQMLMRGRKQYFKEFWALRDISFEIKRGETLGIIGRNGSGKSTLLQLICGTLNPTSGTLKTHGNIAALLELGAGFNPEFTGRENVYLAAGLYGLNQTQIDERFDDIAAFADIGDFINQPVKTYSSGMFVRLAFAVIAHVDADILVVDEALSVGDAYFVQKCMRFLRSFMERGTLLFCSHELGTVTNLCQKAIWLEHGQVAAMGTPKEVTEQYLAALCDIEALKAPEQAVAEALPKTTSTPEDYRDMRQDFINASNLRNDIEVFYFNPESKGFGTGAVRITTVRLLDDNEAPLSWIVGGEMVTVEIKGAVEKKITQPIIGFQLKDRLGQVVFGDNTYLSHRDAAPTINAGGRFTARFEFRMPVMPPGDYSIDAAFAEGAQENNIIHHWLYDAVNIKSLVSSAVFGLVGLPMKRITLETE
jgi:ABC-type polysaccharide/polyol phosphate transport system, ATPase component